MRARGADVKAREGPVRQVSVRRACVHGSGKQTGRPLSVLIEPKRYVPFGKERWPTEQQQGASKRERSFVHLSSWEQYGLFFFRALNVGVCVCVCVYADWQPLLPLLP